MDERQTAVARDLYKRHFGTVPTHMVHAPAPGELLGASAALTDSLCLCAALDRFVYIASAPRSDGKIELVSSTFPTTERFPVDRVEKNPTAPWSHLPKSVLSEFRRRNLHFSGFSAAIVDEIPAGAGLGRFAALQVATALTLRKLWPFSLTPGGIGTAPERGSRGELPSMAPVEKIALARLCQDAQKNFLGVESSLADPLACLFARAWHLSAIDLRFTTIEVLPLIGCVFVLCSLPVPSRAAVLKREACDAAARKLGVKSLRALERSDLPGLREKLSDPEWQLVVHIVGEMARVVAAERALGTADVTQFGAFLLQSNKSLAALESTPSELGAIVDVASKHRACLGARIVGGSVLCLVPHHEAANFVEHLRQNQPAADLTVLQTADAAA